MMFKSVYDVSKPSHPGYAKLEPLLEPGWIPGRKVDNSDAQYAGFRENIPYMAIVLMVHPLLRRAYEAVKPGAKTGGKDGNATQKADQHLQDRVTFDLFFAMIFIIALHGISATKVLLILYLNYQIGTALPRQYVAATTWVFNIGVLFANELCQGYKFADIAAVTLPPTTTGANKPSGDNWGTWLDSYGGLIPRWEILFNITVLRLIAFNFDHLWMLNRRASSPVEVLCVPSNLSCKLMLINSRRKVSIPPTCPNENAPPSAPSPSTSPSATTSPTFSTRRSISPGPL